MYGTAYEVYSEAGTGVPSVQAKFLPSDSALEASEDPDPKCWMPPLSSAKRPNGTAA